MAIDLRSVTGKAIDPVTGKSPSLRKAAPDSSESSVSQSDTVALTETAAKLREAGQTLVANSVIDSELVARVANALQSGDYEIDAERIAEKILELEKKLPAVVTGDG